MATWKSHGRPLNVRLTANEGVALGSGGLLRFLPLVGAFRVVPEQPNGLSRLELQPPRWGGEQVVADGFSRSIRPSSAVADLVEAIWDWDIPDSDAAAAFTIKVPDPVANSI